jgi:hypothetical protein
LNGDGCSSDCIVEKDWDCSKVYCKKSKCTKSPKKDSDKTPEVAPEVELDSDNAPDVEDSDKTPQVEDSNDTETQAPEVALEVELDSDNAPDVEDSNNTEKQTPEVAPEVELDSDNAPDVEDSNNTEKQTPKGNFAPSPVLPLRKIVSGRVIHFGIDFMLIMGIVFCVAVFGFGHCCGQLTSNTKTPTVPAQQGAAVPAQQGAAVPAQQGAAVPAQQGAAVPAPMRTPQETTRLLANMQAEHFAWLKANGVVYRKKN